METLITIILFNNISKTLSFFTFSYWTFSSKLNNHPSFNKRILFLRKNFLSFIASLDYLQDQQLIHRMHPHPQD
jgi:hypothetical protein